MSIKHYIIGFVVGLAVLLLLDFLWLIILARNTYQTKLAHLLAKRPFMPAAVLFYILYIFGLLFLIISPFYFFEPGSVLIRGGVYGLMCYMTYNLSNWATIKQWPVKIVIIDILWGTFLTVCVTGGILSAYKILNLITTAS